LRAIPDLLYPREKLLLSPCKSCRNGRGRREHSPIAHAPGFYATDPRPNKSPRREPGDREPPDATSHRSRSGLLCDSESSVRGCPCGVYTRNMASCHFRLADLRRLVLTRPSGPGAMQTESSVRGCPCPGSRRCSGTDPPRIGRRRQDAGAQSASSERRTGCPKRTSGDGAWAAPNRRQQPANQYGRIRPQPIMPPAARRRPAPSSLRLRPGAPARRRPASRSRRAA
jgi:hypothetical protein